MSNQRIIYSTPDGGVAVVIPSGELPIEQVLAKERSKWCNRRDR